VVNKVYHKGFRWLRHRQVRVAQYSDSECVGSSVSYSGVIERATLPAAQPYVRQIQRYNAAAADAAQIGTQFK